MPDEIFSDEYLTKCWNILDKKTKFVFLLILVHNIIILLFFLINFFPNIWHSGLFLSFIMNYVALVSWIVSIIIILFCKNRLKYYAKNILIKIIMLLSSIHLILYFVIIILVFTFGIG
jgi:hypothetical protein